MQKLEEFINDLGVNENFKNDLIILIDDQNDADYFLNNILSLDKQWIEMIVEMQKYKLLQQPIMSVTEFEAIYNQDEISAVNKLFRCYMTAGEWKDLKEIMKNKGMAHTDLYHLQINNLYKKDISNTWQLVL